MLGWIQGFKYKANIYNLTSPKNVQTLHHREDCAKMRIARDTHIFTHKVYIYINLWTFVDLWSLFGAFSDPVSNVFLILLEITFPTRGHTTIFEKADYMLIFCAAPRWIVTCGTLKKHHKKNFCAKVIFIHNGHIWEMH